MEIGIHSVGTKPAGSNTCLAALDGSLPVSITATASLPIFAT